MAPPASYQESAGTLKSTKFVQTNPLDPIIRPFSDNETSTSQQEYQNEVALNVNSRLEKAMAELVIKHHGNATTHNNNNNVNVGPSNNIINNNTTISHQNIVQYSKKNNNVDEQDDIDDDSDYDSLLNDDNDDDNEILQRLRERRLQEIKQQQQQLINNISKGYGQYRTIQQDEFLKECNISNEYVIVHFYHTEFIRCKVMDHHLQSICQLYTTCKFIRIDSQKSPFFVSKLNIRTLPTIIVFYNGQVINRLIGFTGLQLISSTNNNNQNNNKSSTSTRSRVDESNVENFKTDSLVQWLVSTGAIQYNAKIKNNDDDDDNNDNNNNGNSSSARNRSKYSHSQYYYDGGEDD